MELGERIRNEIVYAVARFHCRDNFKCDCLLCREGGHIDIAVQAIVKIVEGSPCEQPCDSMVDQMEEIARLKESLEVDHKQYRHDSEEIARLREALEHIAKNGCNGDEVIARQALGGK